MQDPRPPESGPRNRSIPCRASGSVGRDRGALLVLDPCVPVLGRERDHPHEHPTVLETAELGALARVHAGVIRLHQDVVRPAGHHVLLARELRDPEGVDHHVVRGGGIVPLDLSPARFEREVDDTVLGDHQDVGRADRRALAIARPHVLVGVLEAPPPLEAFDGDVQRILGRLAREIPDHRDRRHHHDGQDQRGRDRPRDLEARVPVDLRRHALATLAMAEADRDPHDAALDHDEDDHGDPEDGDEQILQQLRIGTLGLERVLRRVGGAGAQQEEEADRGRRPEHPLPHGSFGLPELS